MRLVLFIMLLFAGCNDHPSAEDSNKADTLSRENITDSNQKQQPALSAKVYSNQRFKEVTAERTADNEFLIKGKAQVFEASFSWVIEDGHNELQKGFETTDAGAPEWGNFSFTVKALPEPNTTLHIILFEVSAKDGSRQYELPVPLISN